MTLARSPAGQDDQPFSKAARAAPTAASTSSAPPYATSASSSSLEGLTEGWNSPERGSTNSPPMKRPYRSSSLTMSRDSGAGAYSNADGTGERSCFLSISVKREVVRALVAPGLLLPDLEEQVVQKRGGAEAEEIGRQPLGPQRLVHDHQVLDCLLCLTDAARR